MIMQVWVNPINSTGVYKLYTTGRYMMINKILRILCFISSLHIGIAAAVEPQVAGGWGHTLLLHSDGTVWAWGYNGHGQLGDGTNLGRSQGVQVSGLWDVIAISAGESYSVAVKSNGTVWAWGKNQYGQLSDGTNIDKNTPIQVLNLTGIRSIAAGENHVLALTGVGEVWAWGYNAYGQLGDRNFVNQNTPHTVDYFDDF